MNVRQKAALALAFVVFELSFWSIFLKIGGSSIGIIPQLFYGFLVGLIVSLAVSLFIDKGKGLVAIAKNQNMLLLVIFMGLLNNAFTQLLLGVGTLGTNPSVGAIVYRSYVIVMALLAPLVLKQKVKKLQLLASFVGFLGIYVILSGGTLFTFNPLTTPFMILLLASALCTAFSGLFMSKYTFNVFGAVVIFNLSSLIFITGLAAATHTSLIVTFTPSSIISVLFLGAFAYGIGSSLVYYAIKVYGPLLFGNVILIVPFLTILLAALLTGTPILTYYLVAAVLMSIGVLLQRRYSKIPERVTSKKLLDQLTIFDITSAFVGNKNPVIVNQILGGNRALAIKLHELSYDENLHNQIFSKRGCIAFTNDKPDISASSDEITFINEIMGSEKGESTLIALGNPKELEGAFEEFVGAQSRGPRQASAGK